MRLLAALGMQPKPALVAASAARVGLDSIGRKRPEKRIKILNTIAGHEVPLTPRGVLRIAQEDRRADSDHVSLGCSL